MLSSTSLLSLIYTGYEDGWLVWGASSCCELMRRAEPNSQLRHYRDPPAQTGVAFPGAAASDLIHSATTFLPRTADSRMIHGL